MAPVRLQKVEEKNNSQRLESFLLTHAHFLIPIGICVFAIGLASLCGICAVESGMLRNFLANGV